MNNPTKFPNHSVRRTNTETLSSSNKYRNIEHMFCDHHSAYTWQLKNCKRTVLYIFLQLEGTLKRFATQFTEGRQDRRNVNACYIKKTKVSNRFGFFLFFSVTAPGYWGWAVQIKVAYIQISAIWSWDLWKSFIATNCFPANKWHKIDMISWPEH